MRKTQFLVSALLLVLLLVACAPKTAPAPIPAPQLAAPAPVPVPATVSPVLPAKPAWEVEWDKVVESARKESMVVVYVNSPTLRPSWSTAMERYGLKLEMMIGTAAEIANRILTERRAGIYSGDCLAGSSDTPLTLLKPKGAVEPMDSTLILPEVKDPKMWYEGRLPFVDKDHTTFGFFLFVQPALPINTNLVKPGEIKSYNDLLDSKWRGKIGLRDPTTPGSGGTFVQVVSEIMGWDYLRKLAATEPIIMKDERQNMEWLAHGKVAITLSGQSLSFIDFRRLGAPIGAVIPEEGSWVFSGIGSSSLLNRAPHPNATRVFFNWLLSKEGQTISSKAAGFKSARVDVPTDFLDQAFVPDPNKKYFLAETEEFILSKPEKMKMAKEVFKELLK